ncbi:MAG: transposase [Candidatus Heimdallarchaeota archaeon]
MKIPLIVDETDPKWILLGQVLKIFDSRPVKQQLTRQRMKPVPRAALMLRIVLIAMFFAQEISYVLEELTKRPPLRRFARVVEVPTPKQLSSFLGKFTVAQFLQLILGVLNRFCTPRQRGRSTILVDSTEIRVDLNWFRKKYTKRALAPRDFKWGFALGKGYYIGYKLSLAVAHPSMKPLGFLLHPGSPSDAKLYDIILGELRRRRIARNGDLVVFDKGYFSYENYMKGIARYKIVPGIFPRVNTPREKILSQLAYPLTSYGRRRSARRRALYQRLKSDLRRFLER